MNVSADNLANSQTHGFKEASPNFATQPAGGVRVSGMSTNASQGAIASSPVATDLVIEGDGFLILEGPDGQRLYARDGTVQIDGNNELVDALGNRLLGYAENANGPDTTSLVALRIPVRKSVVSTNGSVASLTGFQITQDGRIQGKFSDGVSRGLGRIAIARFSNSAGLQRRGGNHLAPSPNSGLAVAGRPGQFGYGKIVGGAVESSNTDIGRNLVETILASTQYRVGVRLLDAGDRLLEELLNLRR